VPSSLSGWQAAAAADVVVVRAGAGGDVEITGGAAGDDDFDGVAVGLALRVGECDGAGVLVVAGELGGGVWWCAAGFAVDAHAAMSNALAATATALGRFFTLRDDTVTGCQ
jgi:hypothetical protein